MNGVVSNVLFWRQVFRSPQTYGLFAGTALGYFGFVIWLGERPIVFGVGGAIALATLGAWLWQLHQASAEWAANLLDRATFLAQLAVLDRRFPTISQATWQEARQWAQATQGFAARIAHREPSLTPELLEALHTVLALAGQVAEALQAVEQVQSATYRPLVRQRSQASCDRLQKTHDQLQHLQDQLFLSVLDQEATKSTTSLPLSLRLVIEANRTALQQSAGDSIQFGQES